ncbi:LysR family transcriptional regulator [Acinetobacter wuhouensis]|uniref:LysR family transcriptional regulator n=1 Tax=Acinetobacter wuhouensis TaxID=1879050 RepID=A0A4Q7AM74_9GAMM|nr:LysR family transcriptional regulator [Acinetobacter wuhouensis]RZG48647.1 LysR family transcriptional regulator [Acinetobacter wuhouensis]RZG73042.1 LysR family transcriptional regulator [Acinetobacter wuhouensis]
MFDPRLLRAFVSIVDAGSFTLAAERLHMTQSTISQQLARLEDAVGKPLIDRQSRPLQLTASGEQLIRYARRILALQQEARQILDDPTGTIPIRIGLPEDIMNTEMALILGSFTQVNPNVRLEVTSGLSRELMESYRNGQFDIVIVKESAASADHRATFPEPLAWFESIDHGGNWQSSLALVAFPQGGLYRDEMFELLEREQQNWYIAFTGNSISNILVSVEAGLGLSLLPIATTKNYRVRQYAQFGSVASIAISIYAWDRDGLIDSLVERMTTVLQQRFDEFNCLNL